MLKFSWEGLFMKTVMIIAIIVFIIVLVLTLFAIGKGYQYKHTVDPISPDSKEGLSDDDHEAKK